LFVTFLLVTGGFILTGTQDSYSSALPLGDHCASILFSREVRYMSRMSFVLLADSGTIYYTFCGMQVAVPSGRHSNVDLSNLFYFLAWHTFRASGAKFASSSAELEVKRGECRTFKHSNEDIIHSMRGDSYHDMKAASYC